MCGLVPFTITRRSRAGSWLVLSGNGVILFRAATWEAALQFFFMV